MINGLGLTENEGIPNIDSKLITDMAKDVIGYLRNSEDLEELNKNLSKLRKYKTKYELDNLWYSVEENKEKSVSANNPRLSYAVFITIKKDDKINDIVINSIDFVSAEEGEFVLGHRYLKDLIFDDDNKLINYKDLLAFNNLKDNIEDTAFNLVTTNKMTNKEIDCEYLSLATTNVVWLFANNDDDIDDIVIKCDWDEEDNNILVAYYYITIAGRDYYDYSVIDKFYMHEYGVRYDIKEQVDRELEESKDLLEED